MLSCYLSVSKADELSGITFGIVKCTRNETRIVPRYGGVQALYIPGQHLPPGCSKGL